MRMLKRTLLIASTAFVGALCLHAAVATGAATSPAAPAQPGKPASQPLKIAAGPLISDQLKAQYRQPDFIPFPADNPYTPEKAALGKMLFFDPRLSGSNNMTCASCHNPSFGWEVPFAKAIGSQNTPLKRHAPTILNAAWGKSFFWDGRAATLEEQAAGPIQNPVEMNMPLADLVKKLERVADYVGWFGRVFPGENITERTITRALATYERTVMSSLAPFDAWIRGDEAAISEGAKRGFVLFNEKARCAACHSGWNFTDEKFHDTGLTSDDIGRGEFAPGDPLAQFAFKTPTLRETAQRQPFMHDGSLADLDAVIWHYQADIRRPSLSPVMTRISLTSDEVRDLRDFLETLTGAKAQVPLPILPN